MATIFQLLPVNASAYAGEIDAIYLFIVAVTIFFTVGISAGVLFFGMKYKRKSADESGSVVHESLVLELAWSVVPLLLCIVMFAWGAKVFFSAYNPPPAAAEMYVVGKQWMWKVQHPEGNREINEMHLPLGRPVKLTMTTEDVLHSFYIPAFRVKKDVVPGMYTSMWFTPSKVGKYHLFCAEYCGNQHSGMIGSVHVMDPADYEAWLAGTTRGESMEQAGQRLFERLGCSTCHLQDNSGRGPSLLNVFGSDVTLQSGVIVRADEMYIRESVLRPQAKIVRGYTVEMPTFQGQISEEGILQVISYIKSLAKPAAPAPKPAAQGGAKQ
jgi:cytochrome c oxidase subunit 2